MDARTPPILSWRHREVEEATERQRKNRNKSPEPVSLPPLTPLPRNGHRRNGGHRESDETERKKVTGDTRTREGRPAVRASKNCHHQRPYRVLETGATPLMHACQQADRSRVLRLLVEQKETIGYRDRTLRSALHYCMDAGTGGAVAAAAPELVNAPDAEGHTPLHLAVIAGDARLVAVLLANGADVDAKDSEGHGVLHWATVCGEVECVRLVLAAGARPSTPDLRGGSPLHYAAQCCGATVTARLSVPKKTGLKVLETLLEFGADVDARDEDGRQPILWAASAGSVEAVLVLARAGGSAAAGATDKDGLTALHCAASRGHARCVEALVNLCGCNPDHVDENGCSALHYAATLGHADATALLLRLGADPNRQDRKGRTPALCAAAKGQLETLKILAQHGGSLHARTIRGTGVAHEAVLSGRAELIEWLAKRHPDTLDVATHDGKTPLHVAALYGYLDVCKVLLDHGARINAVLRTSKGGPMTALDAALYRGHRDCAKLVQMHGGASARHLADHRTSTNRVFAAKLRVGEDDSSTDEGSESSSTRGSGNRGYSEERRDDGRMRRERGDGRRKESRRNLRDGGSLSEEQLQVGKSSRSCRHDRCRRSRNRRHLGRRAKSESSRYETKKREYDDESWSESNKYSNEKEKSRVARRASRRPRRGAERARARKDGEDSSSEERSLSDDSLEVVVVVKKSLEKTSEKVRISSQNKSTRVPRETLTETKFREETTRRSKRRSECRLASLEDEKRDEVDIEETGRSKNDKKRTVRVEETIGEVSRDRDRFTGEADLTTDSTSQETVERVTVTALVHNDRLPDTPNNRVKTDDEERVEKPENEVHDTSGQTCNIGEADKLQQQQSHQEMSNGEARPATAETPETAPTLSNEEHISVEDGHSDEERAMDSMTNHGNESSTVVDEATEKQVFHGEEMTTISVEESISPANETLPELQQDVPPETRVDQEAEESTEAVKVEERSDDRGDESIRGKSADADTAQSKDEPIESPEANEGKSSDLVDSIPSSESVGHQSRPSTANPNRVHTNAIVAVIESPEWYDDAETESEDGSEIFRVLPSTSEEETPRRWTSTTPRSTKKDAPLPRVEEKSRTNIHGSLNESPDRIRTTATASMPRRSEQRRDSGGRDSGIEPSPRVSKIPRRTARYRPNTEKQQALDMETVTRDVQISLRRYHLERKIFFQLMELKRLQIRHGRANEHVLVKRQVETFHRAGMSGPTLGVAKYDQPLTFRHFEAFLYEQLRRLQRRPATPDFCTEAKQCTQRTHRCHHATSAYTSVPVYTYLGGGGGHGEGCQEREEGLLPRIESRGKGRMTVRVTKGEEKRVIALPTDKIDRTKRYYVTFSVRGEQQQRSDNDGVSPSSSWLPERMHRLRNNAPGNTKSV